MTNTRNYQKELDQFLMQLTEQNITPNLLLHSCCAPCSSYVLEYLSQYFNITVFYYNPNISFTEEYQRRSIEQQQLIEAMTTKHPISFIQGIYDPTLFFTLVKGHEDESEGGERCFRCYELRLNESAKIAKMKGFDFFTTTLSISPHKNATKLNEIGESLSKEYDIPYLGADFKKKNGFKRSIELSNEFQLYRQNYCGCIYSKLQNEQISD